MPRINHQQRVDKLKTRMAEDLVEGLGQAMAALSFFDTGRNPVHLMINEDTGETLGLVIQGKANVDAVREEILAICDRLMPRGVRIEASND